MTRVTREISEKEVRNYFSHLATERNVALSIQNQALMSLLTEMAGMNRLVARLLYGEGLRISEAFRLRVKDIDYEQITGRQGKGKRIGARSFRRLSKWPSDASFGRVERFGKKIGKPAAAKPPCPRPSPESSQMPQPSGSGSTSFRPAHGRRTREAET